MSAPIVCEGITKRFGDLLAADGVDLSVDGGTVLGFLGPNGAGKTTVLRMIVGLSRPTAGRALLFGRPSEEAAARVRLGYMPADPAFYPTLTGHENLDLLAEMQGAGSPDRSSAVELLELSDEALDKPVREYSSGMAQKLALVQAVQHRPDVVVLDEPANRLDPLAHRRFEQLVRAIAADGRSVLLSSHTLSEVEDVCDRVALMRTGRILGVTAVEELVAAAPRVVRAEFAGPRPERLPDALTSVAWDGNRLTARVARGRLDVIRELADLPGITDLLVEQASLEETFVALYEGTGR